MSTNNAIFICAHVRAPASRGQLQPAEHVDLKVVHHALAFEQE